MQKLRLQNKWNNETKSFDQGSFELRETDGMIIGKLNISSKQKDKFISKAIPFVVFKSQTDLETQDAVKSGQPFLATFNIGVNQFADKETGKPVTYHQLIINEAKLEGIDKHSQAKSNGYQPEVDESDSIPF